MITDHRKRPDAASGRVVQLGAPYKAGRDSFFDGAWAYKVAVGKAGLSVRGTIEDFARNSTALFRQLGGRRFKSLDVVPMLVVTYDDGSIEILGRPPSKARKSDIEVKPRDQFARQLARRK